MIVTIAILCTLVWPPCFARQRMDNFDLASRLYKSISPEKNFVVAITAIEQALIEIYGAASNNSLTRKQISFIGFNGRDKSFINKYAAILKKLSQTVKGLKTGAVIALDQKHEICDQFEKFLANAFSMQNGLSVIKGDFSHQADEILSRINDFISQATLGQIKDFLPPGFVNPSSPLVMANAVRITAKWRTEFMKLRSELFHTFDGSEPLVDMIAGSSSQKQTSYYEDEKVKCLKLLTRYRGISMYVLLPKNASTVQEFKEFAESNYISKIINKPDGLKNSSVTILMPSFEIRDTFNLKESLEKAQISAPFSGLQADFSRLLKSPEKGFHISQMLHTAHIKVDERGFEASGAVGMALIDRRGSQNTFKANKPFHFYITYARSFQQREGNSFENVIFAGQYVGVSP